MSKFEEYKDQIEKSLKRKYSLKTIQAYLYWMDHLWEYFPDVDATEFTFQQLEEYINYLIQRRKSASSTVHQAAHSFVSVFNEVFGMNFEYTSFNLPKRKTQNADVFSKDEIIYFLNNAEDFYWLIFATMYSAGLTLEELQSLRVTDLDLQHKIISIYQTQGRKSRKVVLASSLVKEFSDYLKNKRPQKWLFEGKIPGTQVSDSAIQRSFKRALLKAKINKNVTPKTLKYAYVKHMYSEGIPLISILKYLGMSTRYSSRTYAFYARISYDEAFEIDFSPLDRSIGGSDVEIDSRSIERMLFKVQNEDEREYLLEALKCIRAKLYKAAVIFAWTAAIINIQNKCLQHSENSLNMAIQKQFPKAPRVKTPDDFAYIKDSVTIEASEDLGIFDKNQKAVLFECLGLRNKCGHPSKYQPNPIKVAGFLEDLVQVVFES